MLAPAYRPLPKWVSAVKKHKAGLARSSYLRTEGLLPTDWNLFRRTASYDHQIYIEEYTEAVTSFIAKCTENVTVIKTHYTWQSKAMNDKRGLFVTEGP